MDKSDSYGDVGRFGVLKRVVQKVYIALHLVYVETLFQGLFFSVALQKFTSALFWGRI